MYVCVCVCVCLFLAHIDPATPQLQLFPFAWPTSCYTSLWLWKWGTWLASVVVTGPLRTHAVVWKEEIGDRTNNTEILKGGIWFWVMRMWFLKSSDLPHQSWWGSFSSWKKISMKAPGSSCLIWCEFKIVWQHRCLPFPYNWLAWWFNPQAPSLC